MIAKKMKMVAQSKNRLPIEGRLALQTVKARSACMLD
jgi:hypothetical protein